MMYKLLFTVVTILVLASVSRKAVSEPPLHKDFCVYMIYNGFGPQKSLSSYTQTLIPPASCHGHDALCFWTICGDDDGVISNAEFLIAFEAIDLTDTGDDLLDDEPESLGFLEKLTLTR